MTTLVLAIQPFLAGEQYVDFTQLRSDQLPIIKKQGEFDLRKVV